MNRIALENQILGQTLIGSEDREYTLAKLQPEHFSDPVNRAFFKKLLEIVKSNFQAATIFTIGKEFERKFTDLSEDVVSAVGMRTHVNLLREEVLRRHFVSKASEILKENSTRDILEKLEPLLIEISSFNNKGTLVQCKDIAKELAADITKMQEGKIMGVATGFPKLDNDGLTLRNGELIILGARPSVGKSALSWQMAVQSGVNVAFFSQEMGAKALLKRQLSNVTNLQNKHFHRKDLNPQILKGLIKISSLPIWIDDSQGKTANDILSRCKRFAATRDLGLVVVDYLQLLSFADSTDRRVGIGEAAAKLKQVAQEIDCPVVCISSIKRTADKKQPPSMEDLKESGDIEFHADVIFLMHRDLLDASGETQLIKAKDRNDRAFSIDLIFKRETTSFKEATQEDIQENNYRSFLDD